MRYKFERRLQVSDILKAIGRLDIPTTKVVIEVKPAQIDPETGEVTPEGIEIEFIDYELSDVEKGKLSRFLARFGYIE